MMVRELEVWLGVNHVGTLSIANGRRPIFSYREDWLKRTDAVALSYSLPLQPQAFDDDQTLPFFAGLLPEGRPRELIARQFQVSRQNDFVLLDHLGGECAGAVTLLEPSQSLPALIQETDVQWLSDQELIQVLDELPRRPMLAGTDGLRLSLAGAQDKLPVVVDGDRIGLPLNGAPSSHILKPAISSVADSVTNEGFCLALAEMLGFKPARSRIHHVMDRQFLLVERYDRIKDNAGQLIRLHQEDFCQALGVMPEQKYQNEGGPSLADCFQLLRRVAHPSAIHVLRLWDMVIFNALIGNHDAHGKNFSLLYSSKLSILAPAYDLLSTAVYPNLTIKMAMKIGSKYKFSEVEARHWDQLAISCGLSATQARKRILQLAKRLPDAARQLQLDLRFSQHPVVKEIVEVIEKRSNLTIRRLTTMKSEDAAGE